MRKLLTSLLFLSFLSCLSSAQTINLSVNPSTHAVYPAAPLDFSNTDFKITPADGSVALLLRDIAKQTGANVKAFGAVGDGTTDDTAAIQRAVDSGNGIVYFPDGTFKTTATIFGNTDGQLLTGKGESYGGTSGTTIHYTGTTGAAFQFPKAFNIASIGTSSTAPVVTTTAAHGLTTGDIVRFDLTTGSTCTPALNGTAFDVTVTGSTTFTIQAHGASTVNCSVAPSANTGQGTKYFSRFARIASMTIKGDSASNATQGVRVGIGNAAYTANVFSAQDLHITGFGIGFDNLDADGSKIIGGALYTNGINLRTNTADFFSVLAVNISDASTYGLQVWGSGAGCNYTGGVSSNNPTHVRLESGSRIAAKAVWFEEIKAGGTVAYVDAAASSRATFDHCHEQDNASGLPFISSAGHVIFTGCSTALDFVVTGSDAPQGNGQTGTFNGVAYTASSYIAPGSIDPATAFSAVVPVAKGGTGTTAPALVAGTNISITGTWPNNTINATAGGTATTYLATLSGASNRGFTTLTNVTDLTIASVPTGTYLVILDGGMAYGAGDAGWKWDLKGGTAVFGSRNARYNTQPSWMGSNYTFFWVGNGDSFAAGGAAGATVSGNIYDGEDWTTIGSSSQVAFRYTGTLNVTSAGSIIFREANHSGSGDAGQLMHCTLTLIKQ